MALELRVLVELRSLDPRADDESSLLGEDAGVMVRSDRATTLMIDTGTNASGAFILAGSRLGSVAEEVLSDVKDQIEVAIQNCRRAEAG